LQLFNKVSEELTATIFSLVKENVVGEGDSKILKTYSTNQMQLNPRYAKDAEEF
jgi:hypothetical protein